MGLLVADDVEIRAWDSSAEVRYLVLPERPAGPESLSEEALAALAQLEWRADIGDAHREAELALLLGVESVRRSELVEDVGRGAVR